MNKKDLTALVAKQTNITATEAGKVINAVFKNLRECLENGESTVIQGFGSFSIKNHIERRGVNPATHKPMIIKARKAIRFNPSKNISIK